MIQKSTGSVMTRTTEMIYQLCIHLNQITDCQRCSVQSNQSRYLVVDFKGSETERPDSVASESPKNYDEESWMENDTSRELDTDVKAEPSSIKTKPDPIGSDSSKNHDVESWMKNDTTKELDINVTAVPSSIKTKKVSKMKKITFKDILKKNHSVKTRLAPTGSDSSKCYDEQSWKKTDTSKELDIIITAEPSSIKTKKVSKMKKLFKGILKKKRSVKTRPGPVGSESTEGGEEEVRKRNTSKELAVDF